VLTAAVWTACGRVAAIAVGMGLLAAVVLLARAVRRFGGITGDVLGACVEVATTAALVTLAVSERF
jgi:adenosylcobinamide-GDP ribazoletransferase